MIVGKTVEYLHPRCKANRRMDPYRGQVVHVAIERGVFYLLIRPTHELDIEKKWYPCPDEPFHTVSAGLTSIVEPKESFPESTPYRTAPNPNPIEGLMAHTTTDQHKPSQKED